MRKNSNHNLVVINHRIFASTKDFNPFYYRNRQAQTVRIIPLCMESLLSQKSSSSSLPLANPVGEQCKLVIIDMFIKTFLLIKCLQWRFSGSVGNFSSALEYALAPRTSNCAFYLISAYLTFRDALSLRWRCCEDPLRRCSGDPLLGGGLCLCGCLCAKRASESSLKWLNGKKFVETFPKARKWSATRPSRLAVRHTIVHVCGFHSMRCLSIPNEQNRNLLLV